MQQKRSSIKLFLLLNDFKWLCMLLRLTRAVFDAACIKKDADTYFSIHSFHGKAQFTKRSFCTPSPIAARTQFFSQSSP